MPERYIKDPELMARAVKHCVSSVRWLTAALLGIIFWSMIVTGLLFAERAEDNRQAQKQRHEDCLAALDTREIYRDIDIAQWTEAVESEGPNPEGVAYAREFITAQYDALPEPAVCR